MFFRLIVLMCLVGEDFVLGHIHAWYTCTKAHNLACVGIDGFCGVVRPLYVNPNHGDNRDMVLSGERYW